MKNGIKIVAALAIAFAGMFGTTTLVSHVAATTSMQECGCGQAKCNGGCRLALRAKRTCATCEAPSGCVQCPQCDGEMCKLELDNSKVKKTCFKVEQKAVCIPPVRMPWMKCCPPGTSKTRTINVLKKHSYECKNCSYKWTLQEPEVNPMPNAPVAPALSFPETPVHNSIYEPQPWNANSLKVEGQFVPTQGK